MGVRQLQYAKEFEKEKKRGATTEAAHEKAVKKSTVKKVPKKENWVERLKKDVEEWFRAEKAAITARVKQQQIRDKIKARKKRTKSIERQLRVAGLTEEEIFGAAEEIAKLRGKK